METLTSATHSRHRPRHSSGQSQNRNTIRKLDSYDNRNNRNKFSYKKQLSSYDHVPTSSYETPKSLPLRPPSQPAPRSWRHRRYPTPLSGSRNTYPKLDSYNNRNKKTYDRPLTLSPTPGLVAASAPAAPQPSSRNMSPKLRRKNNRNKNAFQSARPSRRHRLHPDQRVREARWPMSWWVGMR